MRLTDEEKAAIKAGERVIRRPVRKRRNMRGTMRDLRTSVKRGTVARVDENTCISVLRVSKKDGEWHIHFETLPAWALTPSQERQIGRDEIAAGLPGALRYDEEPDLVVGDIFEFPEYRDKVRDPNRGYMDRKNEWREGGEPINEDVPALYIEITSISRDKKGKWVARYRKHGFEEDEYMAPKLGYTKNPERAISRAPVVKVKPDPVVQARDETLRELKRLETLRAGLQQQVMNAKGPGRLIVATKALEQTERKMRHLQGLSAKRAA